MREAAICIVSKRKGKKTESQEENKHVFLTEITCPLNMPTLWFNKSLYCILSMIFQNEDSPNKRSIHTIVLSSHHERR